MAIDPRGLTPEHLAEWNAQRAALAETAAQREADAYAAQQTIEQRNVEIVRANVLLNRPFAFSGQAGRMSGGDPNDNPNPDPNALKPGSPAWWNQQIAARESAATANVQSSPISPASLGYKEYVAPPAAIQRQAEISERQYVESLPKPFISSTPAQKSVSLPGPMGTTVTGISKLQPAPPVTNLPGPMGMTVTSVERIGNVSNQSPLVSAGIAPSSRVEPSVTTGIEASAIPSRQTPVEMINSKISSIPVLSQVNILGASVGSGPLEGFVKGLEGIPLIGGAFTGIKRGGEVIGAQMIAEANPTQKNIDAYQTASQSLLPSGVASLPSTPFDNLIQNAAPWWIKNVETPFSEYIAPTSNLPFLGQIDIAANVFVSAPDILLNFGTTVVQGWATLAKNWPSFVPLATAGVAMQIGGAYTGITTNPVKFAAEQMVYIAGLGGGQEALTRGVGIAKTTGKQYIPIERIGYSPEKGYPIGSGQTELTLKESFSKGTLSPEPTSMKQGISEIPPYIPEASHLPNTLGEPGTLNPFSFGILKGEGGTAIYAGVKDWNNFDLRMMDKARTYMLDIAPEKVYDVLSYRPTVTSSVGFNNADLHAFDAARTYILDIAPGKMFEATQVPYRIAGQALTQADVFSQKVGAYTGDLQALDTARTFMLDVAPGKMYEYTTVPYTVARQALSTADKLSYQITGYTGDLKAADWVRSYTLDVLPGKIYETTQVPYEIAGSAISAADRLSMRLGSYNADLRTFDIARTYVLETFPQQAYNVLSYRPEYSGNAFGKIAGVDLKAFDAARTFVVDTIGEKMPIVPDVGYEGGKGKYIGVAYGRGLGTLENLGITAFTGYPETTMKNIGIDITGFEPSSVLKYSVTAPTTYQSYTAWERGIGLWNAMRGGFEVPSMHSEINAMYAAPVAETYFTKFGTSQARDMFGFSITGVRQPAIINVAFESLEAVPKEIVSKTLELKTQGEPNVVAYDRMNTYLKNQLLENPAAAKAYLPLTKQEYEMVIPTGTKLQVLPSRYYTTLEGVRVPITELKMVPGVSEKTIVSEVLGTPTREYYQEPPLINVPNVVYSNLPASYTLPAFPPLEPRMQAIPIYGEMSVSRSLPALQQPLQRESNAIKANEPYYGDAYDFAYGFDVSRAYSNLYNSSYLNIPSERSSISKAKGVSYSEEYGSEASGVSSAKEAVSLGRSLGSSMSSLGSSIGYGYSNTYSGSSLSYNAPYYKNQLRERYPYLPSKDKQSELYKKKNKPYLSTIFREILPIITPIEELGGFKQGKSFFRAIGNQQILEVTPQKRDYLHYVDVDQDVRELQQKETASRVSDMAGTKFFRTATKQEKAKTGKPIMEYTPTQQELTMAKLIGFGSGSKSKKGRKQPWF